jgi:hypothetical protein
MSTVVSKNVQIGADGTASNNFTAYQPSTPDGTLRIGNGNSGSVTDAIVLNSSGVVSFTNNPTLSGGTANGVAYLNGSKVLTSGSALTTNGSSLGVGSSDFGGAGSINVSVGVAGTTTGGLQLWSTTTGQHYVQFGDGTAGAATYAGAIGYSHATDQMFFYANAAEQMRLTSTGLGIGTSSITSGFKLDVLGDARFSDVAGDDGVELGWSAGGSAGFVQAYDRGASAFRDLSLNNAVTISSSGNVGIGTSSPSGKLQVKQANTAYGLVVEASGNDAWVRFHHNDSLGIVETTYNTSAGYTPLTFKTGGTERMRIDSSGNVGIGTSSPTDKLSVGTSAGGTQVKIQSGSGVNNCILHTNGTTDSWRVGMNLSLTNGSYEFYDDINNVTRLILDSSGNLLVNRTTTTTSLGGDTPVVFANGAFCSFVGSYNAQYSSDRINFNNGNYYVVNGSTVGVKLVNGATSWTTQSDERKKDIIEPITSAVDKVLTLRAVIGKYKTDEDGVRRSFLIAQDVQSALPEAVDSGDSEDLGVRYTEVIPLLVAAIKEQQAIIESLKARLDAANI